MKNFWQSLPKPFFAQAPMEDVTDAAFRRLIARYGKPDVMFTEFTSADGLVLAPEEGKAKLSKKLIFSESERPIVAQLFTSSPERMEQAAALVAKLGFDGIDINMGCPDKAVEKSGCGASLIKNPALARELIRAAKRGWSAKYGHSMSIFPISVKTRIGYNADELNSWLPELLAEEPAAIIIHARTRKEMSDVSARWETIARAVGIRNLRQGKTLPGTLIVGNGDVRDIADARAKADESGCDGVMLGRAIFGNPFLFANSNELANNREAKLKALSEHLRLFDELLGDTANYATIAEQGSDMPASLGRDGSELPPRSSFAVMKKHFKAYVSGWDGAKELRSRLMDTQSCAESREVIDAVCGSMDVSPIIEEYAT